MSTAKSILRQFLAAVGSALALSGSANLQAQMVIQEIHADPPVKTEAVEFVELVNAGSEPVLLSGWRLSGGIEFSFPAVTVPAGGLVVVAQNPTALKAKFGVDALGPWLGRLDAQGDEIELLNAAGQRVDVVDFGLGFPWPTVGDLPGYSIELIHPGLDNELGGNWRRSLTGANEGDQATLIAPGSTWRYQKGTQEPSSPASAWRESGFNDASWSSGALPVGYDPALPLGTRLTDMNGGYTTVYLRRTFEVQDPNRFDTLELQALYDDGFKLWINGTRVLNVNVADGELPFSGTAGPARESNDFETFTASNARALLRTGNNIVTVQLINTSLSSSSDCFFDLRLIARSGPTGAGPTPGRPNVVSATNAPPAIRQVEHSPEQPRSGSVVRITAKVTDPDGVTAVQLKYQVVEPGAYIELTDPEYTTAWSTLGMNDAGTAGDVVPGDGVYTAVLPPSVQAHRRLVRYRIEATDGKGAKVVVPYADDAQPNFAYFVYDGVPAWTGSVKPGDAGALGQTFTVSADEMNRLPVLQLLGKKATVEQSTWLSRYGGDAYPWLGTLVYDGRVYDHIRHRARGGVWRYAMTKNMWKFDLNRGHDFEARDNWGRRFRTGWTKVNLGASIQQGDYNHRGEQGMFESVGLRTFQLAGVEAPNTAFVQFRVVDEAAEVSADNQYEGDFWGVYLLVEQENGRFLDEHGLPDGNLYKMENGTGELNNMGPDGPADKSDLNAFLAGYNNATEDWWRTHFNIPSYLGYQTVVQAIHHYDICYDKNFFYYLNPVTQRWQVVPWDLDLTWAENMYDAGCGGVDRIKQRLIPGATRYPAVWREWQNRIREFRDLFWNADEAYRLIDEYAGRLRGPTGRPSLLDADRAQWDYNPKMISAAYSTSPGSKAGHGRYYKWPNYSAAVAPRSFDGAIAVMKRYVGFRATNSAAVARNLDALAFDAAIPARPSITYVGPEGFPANRLRFRTSGYSGSAGFGAQRWRVGEITRAAAPSWQASEPWAYEIEEVWESGSLATFQDEISVPAGVLRPGRVYRARVQVLDADGRASRWSDPVEFVAGEPDNAALLAERLRITELMYDPAGGAGFEFVELRNTSESRSLELTGVRFTQGISFEFPAGSTLGAGQYGLVIRTNAEAFRARYGVSPTVPLFGPFDGSLNNDGERLVLRTSAGGTDLLDFEYRDGAGWPMAAGGAGHSLVPRAAGWVDPAGGSLDWGGNWRASTWIGGSPGTGDPEPPASVILNEVVTHTDFLSEADSNDWIELANPTGASVVLGDGWYLSDDPEDLSQWQIPAGTTLPAFGTAVFDEQTGFNTPVGTGFGLNKAGERVFLSHFPGNGPGRVVDAVRVPGQDNGWSWGRSPDRGQWWDTALSRTRGGPNGAGAVYFSPEISEILFEPPGDVAEREYLELFRPMAKTSPGPAPAVFEERLAPSVYGPWRVTGDVEYYFPADFTLPLGRTLLVGFDPSNAAALEAFRNHYQVPAGVTILGPWTGRLSNRSGRIALEKPIGPDAQGGANVWVTVHEFSFGNRDPWPRADGNGLALHRKTLGLPGSDPGQWTAAAPSPGVSRDTTEDADNDGMPDDWETAFGLNPQEASDAAADLDADGLTNLEEYLSGTDPRNPASRLSLVVEAVDGETITLVVQAAAQREYRLESAVGLGGDWAWVQNVRGGASEGPVTLTIAPPAGTSETYFRVRTW